MKFDKKKCKICNYRGERSGGYNLSCNYSGITGETCLKRGPKGTVIDIRGDDPENCLLFEPGKSNKRMDKLYVGKQRYERRG